MLNWKRSVHGIFGRVYLDLDEMIPLHKNGEFFDCIESVNDAANGTV